MNDRAAPTRASAGGLRGLSADDFVRGVEAGDRAVLARAISLVESISPRHQELADEVLRRLMPRTGRSARVGVTGVPGAGKSTFIERAGVMLCESGRRVAVLAIDPSSAVSGGSILGDRTRMGRLGAMESAYVRPSPSGATLGGVARRTREAALLCEAAGYDVVMIETVGVGQSETLVADMVDCVLNIALPGAGDELQGVKRGILEVVDVIAVNKADGDNRERARLAAAELTSAMRALRADEHGGVPVLTCSAATGEGVPEVWGMVERCLSLRRESGELASRRRSQALRWMHAIIDERVRRMVTDSTESARALRSAEREVLEGTLSPGAGAARVLAALAAGLSGAERKETGR